MSKRNILIISCVADHHANTMVQQLQEMGHEPIRLNTDDIPLDVTMSFCFSTDKSIWNGHLALQTQGHIIDLEHIRSIWWRRPGEYFGLPPELSLQEREFAKGEIEQVLRGLFSPLDCYWISHPDHIRQAGGFIK